LCSEKKKKSFMFLSCVLTSETKKINFNVLKLFDEIKKKSTLKISGETSSTISDNPNYFRQCNVNTMFQNQLYMKCQTMGSNSFMQ
jgi:hypothetical protein